MTNEMTFIIARPGEAGAALCADIANLFGRALHFPTIEFAPPVDVVAFEKAIAQAGEQDWLIFISAQAVKSVVPALRAAWPIMPERVKLAAVGPTTAAALTAAGYRATYSEDEWSSEGLMALPAFQQVRGQSIMIMRGVGGREALEKILKERGAEVSACVAYQRMVPSVDASVCQQLIKHHSCSAIIAGSFETVTNLKLLLGEAVWLELTTVPLIVMSERIKALAADLGFQRIWVTRNASQQAVIDLITANKDVLCPRVQQ